MPGLAERLDHLLKTGLVADGQVIDQQHREGLVADQMTRAPYRMAKAERWLARVAELARRGQPAGHRLQLGRLRRQNVLELGSIEVILEDALAAAGDRNELLDPGGALPRTRTG